MILQDTRKWACENDYSLNSPTILPKFMCSVCFSTDRWLFAILGFTLLIVPRSARADVDFAHQIVPILRQHCAECHTGDAKKGGFSINDHSSLLAGSESGSMVTVGKSDESYLIELVMSTDPDVQMPPKGARLTNKEVAILRKWIDEGLKWESGFAFKKPPYEPPLGPRKPELPPPVGGRHHPIDRIIDQYLAKNQLHRPAGLEDLAFLRRTSLDLVGLLPEPEAVQAFMESPSSEKRTRWIATLLADDIGYTEHWLSFWNDLLRNDYSGTGFITGGRKQISNWLYRSLVANKPFDQFTRELIAPDSDESRGFIDGIKWRGDVSAGQTVEIQFAQSVAQSFLGINMKCASCHDSFIDRWKLSEAYGLAAVYSTRPLEITRCDMPTGEQAKAAWIFPEMGTIDPNATQSDRLQQLAKLMTSSQNGRFARTIANRLWYRMMGRGIVHPVDAMQSEPWNADLLDHLASQFVDDGYDLRKLLFHIATSEAYQSQSQIIDSESSGEDFQYQGPRSKRLTSEQFVDAIWFLTGTAPQKYDAPILRGKFDEEAQKNVQITGKWIWADFDHKDVKREQNRSILFRKKLTIKGPVAIAGAMITANQSFTLFVNNREVSQDDDWQSVEMIPIHQQLREGSNTIVIVANGTKEDPSVGGLFFEAKLQSENGKFQTIASDDSWEATESLPAMNEKRLKALDETKFQAAKVIEPRPEWSTAIQTQGPMLLSQAMSVDRRLTRASLMKSDFLMRTLGRPNRDQIVSMRPSELTTLEAIDLANGQKLAELMTLGAKRLAGMTWKDNAGLVVHMYRTALTRDPTSHELAIAKTSLGESPSETSIEDLLWAICMTPEFHYVR